MAKEKPLDFVKDWKHWVGWLITTVGIYLVLKFIFDLTFGKFIVYIGIFATIVIIDIIKHLIKFQ